jgi:hypothetical protein
VFNISLAFSSNPDSLLVMLSTVDFIVCSFLFFDGTGVWSQGFGLTKQVLYCLIHTSVHFCSGYFVLGCHEVFAQASFEPRSPDLNLPSRWDWRREPQVPSSHGVILSDLLSFSFLILVLFFFQNIYLVQVLNWLPYFILHFPESSMRSLIIFETILLNYLNCISIISVINEIWAFEGIILTFFLIFLMFFMLQNGFEDLNVRSESL